jgi:hypothetical protein
MFGHAQNFWHTTNSSGMRSANSKNKIPARSFKKMRSVAQEWKSAIN